MPGGRVKESNQSMEISLQNTGKRYNREWIFRHLQYNFTNGNSYAITGANGSGKSTLLQVIAGAILHSEGRILHTLKGNIVTDQPYKHIAYAAPYLELVEEMTPVEFLHFFNSFKSLLQPVEFILNEVGLSNASHKQIRYFSSGMKQRLKLAQAFFSDTPVLILDEPTTNLDEDGVSLYLRLIKGQTAGRMLIVGSNDKREYAFCDNLLSMSDYK